MSGEIVGGWEYVIAAYVLSALVYGGYAYSVIRRDNDSRAAAASTVEAASAVAAASAAAAKEKKS